MTIISRLALIVTASAAVVMGWNAPATPVEPLVTGVGWMQVDGEWVPQLDVQLRMEVSPIWNIGLQVAPVLSDPSWKKGSLDLMRYGLVATPRIGLGVLVVETPLEFSAVNGSYLKPIKGEGDKPEIDETGGWGVAVTASLVVAYPVSQSLSIALQGGWRHGLLWVHGVDEDVMTGGQLGFQFRWNP